jgi:hypothetical protein
VVYFKLSQYENYAAFQQRGKGLWRLMQPARRPVIANPQGEAIQRTRMDCFTRRVRKDGHDNLNSPAERTEKMIIHAIRLTRLITRVCQKSNCCLKKRQIATYPDKE